MTYVVFALALVALLIVVRAILALFRGPSGRSENTVASLAGQAIAQRNMREVQQRAAEGLRVTQQRNEDMAKRNRAMTQAAIDQANKAAKLSRGW